MRSRRIYPALSKGVWGLPQQAFLHDQPGKGGNEKSQCGLPLALLAAISRSTSTSLMNNWKCPIFRLGGSANGNNSVTFFTPHQ
jgi:hypothetical protein